MHNHPDETGHDLREEVELWFRTRGLPLFVRGRPHPLLMLVRMVPGVVFLGLFQILFSVLDAVSDETAAGAPDDTGFTVVFLAALALALVLPAVSGWLISRGFVFRDPESTRSIAIAAALVVAFLVAVPLIDVISGLSGTVWSAMLANAALTTVLYVLVLTGTGSVLSWALRNAIRQLRVLGNMASRALPLLLLVILFSFFSAETWQLSGSLSRSQLWGVLALFIALGVLFLAAVLSDELRELATTRRADPERLAAYRAPLADGSPPPAAPLQFTERLNVVVVLFLAHLIQVLVFSALVFGFLLVLGKLAVGPELLRSWTGHQHLAQGELFGIRVPAYNDQLQTALYLCVFSGLYFAASTATDPVYRKSFFEPLLEDMAVSLTVRDRYLRRWPG